MNVFQRFHSTNKWNYKVCVKRNHSWPEYLQTVRINAYVVLIHEPLVKIGIIPAWWKLKRNIKRANKKEVVALLLAILMAMLLAI
jgi:hypothetical protein